MFSSTVTKYLAPLQDRYIEERAICAHPELLVASWLPGLVPAPVIRKVPQAMAAQQPDPAEPLTPGDGHYPAALPDTGAPLTVGRAASAFQQAASAAPRARILRFMAEIYRNIQASIAEVKKAQPLLTGV